MRVAEEHPFISYFIKLTFINGIDGKNVVLDVDSSMEVDRVKMQVVSHFQGSNDNLKKSLYFSLVSVKSSRVLAEKTRISETGLANGGILLSFSFCLNEIWVKFIYCIVSPLVFGLSHIFRPLHCSSMGVTSYEQIFSRLKIRWTTI